MCIFLENDDPATFTAAAATGEKGIEAGRTEDGHRGIQSHARAFIDGGSGQLDAEFWSLNEGGLRGIIAASTRDHRVNNRGALRRTH